MSWRHRTSIGLLIVLLPWPLFVWWNTSTRFVTNRFVVYSSLTMIVIACLTSGLWRVLVTTIVGSILGLLYPGNWVNGSGLDDVKSLVIGAVAGAVCGFVWHHLNSLDRNRAFDECGR